MHPEPFDPGNYKVLGATQCLFSIFRHSHLCDVKAKVSKDSGHRQFKTVYSAIASFCSKLTSYIISAGSSVSHDSFLSLQTAALALVKSKADKPKALCCENAGDS